MRIVASDFCIPIRQKPLLFHHLRRSLAPDAESLSGAFATGGLTIPGSSGAIRHIQVRRGADKATVETLLEAISPFCEGWLQLSDHSSQVTHYSFGSPSPTTTPQGPSSYRWTRMGHDADDPDLSLYCFQRAGGSNDGPEFWHNLAQGLHETRRNEEAIGACLEGLSQTGDPGMVRDLCFLLQKALIDRFRETGERDFLRQAMKAGTDGLAARTAAYLFYDRACAASLLGAHDAALQDLSVAIRMDPDHRHEAASDPDFAPIRSLPGFISLTSDAFPDFPSAFRGEIAQTHMGLSHCTVVERARMNLSGGMVIGAHTWPLPDGRYRLQVVTARFRHSPPRPPQVGAALLVRTTVWAPWPDRIDWLRTDARLESAEMLPEAVAGWTVWEGRRGGVLQMLLFDAGVF